MRATGLKDTPPSQCAYSQGRLCCAEDRGCTGHEQNEQLMTVQIRPARADDLAQCVDLLDELFRLERDFAPDARRQMRGLSLLLENDSARVLVADDDGEVVGMLSVQRLVSTAEGGSVGLVEDVVVPAVRRGQGIGRALMDAAEEWARRENLSRLQLLAERGNQPAQAFYQRLGWASTQLLALRMGLR